MSVGWGFRGDYGHEAGALVPGALLALAICLAAGRADWWGQASVLALLGALGWAFGGQMSYGLVIGYTAHTSFPDVLYGYACLFVIGGLWGGIGAGVLAFGVTRTRAELEAFAGPLAAVYAVLTLLSLSGVTGRLSSRWPLYDTDWVAASAALLTAGLYGWLRPSARSACRLIVALAAGWWLGFGLLTGLLHLRMTPPRSDNWAGCVGLWLALVVYLIKTRNRAALSLSLYGLLAGGLGFAVGDFLNMVGRAQWGLIGRSETLRGLDSWKWMEQFFGFVMGFGVALGFAGLRRLKPAADQIADQMSVPVAPVESDGVLRYLALWFLLIAMQWENLHRNVRVWSESGYLAEGLFGITPQRWVWLVAVLLSALLSWVIVRHRSGGLELVPSTAFGRAQLLFLLLLWLAVVADFTRALPALKSRSVLFVHLTFWLTAFVCTLIVLRLSGKSEVDFSEGGMAADEVVWVLGWKYWWGWAMVPILLFVLAKLSMAMHDQPLPGSHLRIGAGL
jgi:hypothetical protein